jgi:PKD repeat protein
MKKLIILSGIFAISNLLNAQQGHWCTTHSLTEEVLNANPERKAKFLEAERKRIELDQNSASASFKSSNSSSVLLTIPVVFHVVHQYGSENISRAQILDAVAILNRDFQKLNADTATVHPNFKPIIGNTQVEFKLATTDENGNCTDGITRIFDPVNTNLGAQPALAAGRTWNPTKYLNIYVVKAIASGAAGYTYKPGAWPAGNDNDAIVILHNYCGSIGTGTPGLSRALTHEVGHWLSLSHVWGSTNQPNVACGDDGITDTPVTKGWINCNVNGKSCPSDPAPVDNLENYMEYAYCQKMFTIGQATRMKNELLFNTGGGGRSNLYSAANLLATGVNVASPPICKPVADFNSPAFTVCANTPLSFTESSWKGLPTSYIWRLIGPTTYTDSGQVASFSPSVVGKYDVRLIVSNSAGTDSITRINVVDVKSDVAFYTFGNFSENFGPSFSYVNGWEAIDPDFDNGFLPYTGAGVGDNNCLALESVNAFGPNETDFLITPGINLTSMPATTKLVFYWAFAKHSAAASTDKLAMDMSLDCGIQWSQRLQRTGANFKSTNTLYPAYNFIPTSAQWKRDSFAIGPLTNFPNIDRVSFRFRFTNNANIQANPFYLDKISLEIPSGIDDVKKAIDLNIFPNPSKGQVKLSFNALSTGKLEIEVTNLLGQTQFNKAFNVNFGTQTLDLSKDKTFTPGIYFMKRNIGEIEITKKLVIE